MSFKQYMLSRLLSIIGRIVATIGITLFLFTLFGFFWLFPLAVLIIAFGLYAFYYGEWLKKKVEPKGRYKLE